VEPFDAQTRLAFEAIEGAGEAFDDGGPLRVAQVIPGGVAAGREVVGHSAAALTEAGVEPGERPEAQGVGVVEGEGAGDHGRGNGEDGISG